MHLQKAVHKSDGRSLWSAAAWRSFGIARAVERGRKQKSWDSGARRAALHSHSIGRALKLLRIFEELLNLIRGQQNYEP